MALRHPPRVSSPVAVDPEVRQRDPPPSRPGRRRAGGPGPRGLRRARGARGPGILRRGDAGHVAGRHLHLRQLPAGRDVYRPRRLGPRRRRAVLPQPAPRRLGPGRHPPVPRSVRRVAGPHVPARGRARRRQGVDGPRRLDPGPAGARGGRAGHGDDRRLACDRARLGVADGWTKACPFANGVPSVPLFNSPGIDHWVVVGDERLRLYLLDLPGAGTVAVDLDAFQGDAITDLLGRSAVIVRSLKFAAPAASGGSAPARLGLGPGRPRPLRYRPPLRRPASERGGGAGPRARARVRGGAADRSGGPRRGPAPPGPRGRRRLDRRHGRRRRGRRGAGASARCPTRARGPPCGPGSGSRSTRAGTRWSRSTPTASTTRTRSRASSPPSRPRAPPAPGRSSSSAVATSPGCRRRGASPTASARRRSRGRSGSTSRTTSRATGCSAGA